MASKPAVSQALQEAKPWNPYRLLTLSYFLTVIGAGIWMGLNWKRLGRPEWSRNTIILSIVIPVVSLALMLGGLALLLSKQEPSQAALIFPLVFMAFGVNYGFIWALARLQNGAYKKWKANGAEAMLAHEYDPKNAMIFGIGFAVAAIAIGIVLALTSR